MGEMHSHVDRLHAASGCHRPERPLELLRSRVSNGILPQLGRLSNEAHDQAFTMKRSKPMHYESGHTRDLCTRKCTHLVIAGSWTESCVINTARGASTKHRRGRSSPACRTCGDHSLDYCSPALLRHGGRRAFSAAAMPEKESASYAMTMSLRG